MTYAGGGATLKEFRALCPVSRFMAARVYSRATAGNARRFLADLVEATPFPVLSIQADGGSEFMAEFEDGCEELGSPSNRLRSATSCRAGGPSGTTASSAPTAPPRPSSGNLYDGPLTVSAVADALSGYEFFHNYERPMHPSTTAPRTSKLSLRRPPSPPVPNVLNQTTSLYC